MIHEVRRVRNFDIRYGTKYQYECIMQGPFKKHSFAYIDISVGLLDYQPIKTAGIVN